jgi:hypothetical protein
MYTPRAVAPAVERSISRASILPCCVYRKMRGAAAREEEKRRAETKPTQARTVNEKTFKMMFSYNNTKTDGKPNK